MTTGKLNEYHLKDLKLGQIEKLRVVITQEMVDTFIQITGDDNSLHTDEEYCKSLDLPGIVAHGCLTSSFFSTFVGKRMPGRYARFLSLNVSWHKPVFIGDSLKFEGVITGITESVKVVTIKIQVFNQRAERVASGKIMSEVLK